MLNVWVIGLLITAIAGIAQASELDQAYSLCEGHHQVMVVNGREVKLSEYKPGYEMCADVGQKKNAIPRPPGPEERAAASSEDNEMIKSLMRGK